MARVGRLLFVCAALASLASCGTQFVCNRLDWLTHYYLSSQVSLHGSQSRELRDRLERFFAWHRRSELPRFAEFLTRPEKRWDAEYRRDFAADRAHFIQLLAEINQNLTPAQRSRTVERLRVYARDLRRLAAEPAA